jgi:hypothetical protein
MPTVCQWPTRPIATLVSEMFSYEVQWHGPDNATQPGGVQNELRFQVEFKYKRPYGSSACYRVCIDRPSGTGFVNIITDLVSHNIEAGDNDWHSQYKEYAIAMPAGLLIFGDRVLSFRISAQIEGPGYYSDDSSGSLGRFSAAESRDFNATFTRPTLSEVEKHIEYLEQYLRDVRQEYRKRAKE